MSKDFFYSLENEFCIFLVWTLKRVNEKTTHLFDFGQLTKGAISSNQRCLVLVCHLFDLGVPAPPRRLPSHGVAAPPPGPRSSHDSSPPPFPHLPSPPRLCSHGSARSTPLHRRLQQQAGATRLGTGEPLLPAPAIPSDVLWTVPVVEAWTVPVVSTCGCIKVATTLCSYIKLKLFLAQCDWFRFDQVRI